MGDKKFTFIELHLDGNTQFGPKRIGDVVGGEDELDESAGFDIEDEDEEAVGAPEEDGNGGKALGVVVTLLILAGIALAVKKLRGEEDEELPPEEEPDIIVN
ncbi:hypothetical protein ACYJ1Y_05435 [Natrialbaceae archaeon A-gly3]